MWHFQVGINVWLLRFPFIFLIARWFGSMFSLPLTMIGHFWSCWYGWPDLTGSWTWDPYPLPPTIVCVYDAALREVSLSKNEWAVFLYLNSVFFSPKVPPLEFLPFLFPISLNKSSLSEIEIVLRVDLAYLYF